MKIELINFGLKKYPERAHYNDAGLDVFAHLNCNKIEIKSNSCYKIPLGFGIKLPDGYVGFVCPRSSLSSKGISCEMSPIDSGYCGEIHAILNNNNNYNITINNGDKIGQLVIFPCILIELVNNLELSNKRGINAFGSTDNENKQ